jgi:hypothetical protein
LAAVAAAQPWGLDMPIQRRHQGGGLCFSRSARSLRPLARPSSRQSMPNRMSQAGNVVRSTPITVHSGGVR